MPPTPPRYQAAIQATQRRLDQVVATGGIAPVRSLFGEVSSQLERDLAKLPGGTFDDARKRSAALQVRAAILRLNQASATIAEKGSIDAQLAAVQELATQVQGLERDFRGTVVPVPLLEGARFRGLAANRATSLLTQHRASMARYGAGVIGDVEGVMARSLIGNESTTDTIDKIAVTIDGTRWQAERIHRTEQAWSYNAGHVDGLVTQATTLPDLMMRWSEHVSDDGAALDDRVAVDSLAMHGQLATPGGLFTQPPAAPDGEQVPDGLVLQTWAHPPNRPNDRAVISPWREHWGVPGWTWQGGARKPYTGSGRVPEISTKDEAPPATGGEGLPAPLAPAAIEEELAPAPLAFPPRPPAVVTTDNLGVSQPRVVKEVLLDTGFASIEAAFAAQAPPPGYSIDAQGASVLTDQGIPAGVLLEGEIRAPDGSLAGLFTRKYLLDPDGKVVIKHDSLDIVPKHRGHGISDSMNAAAFQAYEAAGVDRVEMTAAYVGRYQWMRLGFEVAPESRPKIVESFHRWARNNPELADHADRLTNLAKDMLARPGGIADLDVEGVKIRIQGRDGEIDVPVGKAFLLDACPEYKARLPIKRGDPFYERAMRRLRDAEQARSMRSPGVAASAKAPAPTGVAGWMATKGKLLAATAPTGAQPARVIAEAKRRRALSDVMFASVSSDPELGAVARGGLERVLRESGIATPLDAGGARNRAAATISVSKDLDTGGVHDWDGSIHVGRRTAAQVASMAEKLARGAGGEVTGPELGSLNVLIHEHLHGATPISREGYEGVGAMVEEVSTEALARRATRRLAASAGVHPSQVAAGGVGAPRHEGDGAYASELLQVRRAIQDVTGLGDDDAYDLLERASQRLKSRAADPRQRALSAKDAAAAFAEDLAAEHGDAKTAGRFREMISGATRDAAATPRSDDPVARFEVRYGRERVEERLAELREEVTLIELSRHPTTMQGFEKEAEAKAARVRGVEPWQLTSTELDQVKREVAAEKERREVAARKAAEVEIEKDRAKFTKLSGMVREGKVRAPPTAKLDAAVSTKAATERVLEEERQAVDQVQREAARVLATAQRAADDEILSWADDVTVVPTDDDLGSIGLVKRGDKWIDTNDDDYEMTEEEARDAWADAREDDPEEAKIRKEIEKLTDAMEGIGSPTDEWDGATTTLEELVGAEPSQSYGDVDHDADDVADTDRPSEMTTAEFRAALAADRDRIRRRAELAQAAMERLHASQTRSRDRIKTQLKELEKAGKAAGREAEKEDPADLVVGDDEEGEAYAAAEFLLEQEAADRAVATSVSGGGYTDDDLDQALKDAATATARAAKALAKVTGREAEIAKPAKRPKAAAKAKTADDDDDDD